MNISSIISKLAEGYHIPEKGCSCGCNTCHLPNSMKTESKSIIETDKRVKTVIGSTLSKILKEYKNSTIVKLEGILVTDISERNQEEILSDIRSIAGVTIVSSEKLLDNASYSSDHFRSKLSVKIDPHPFIGKGGMNREKLKNILLDITRIQGVRSFKLITKPKTV